MPSMLQGTVGNRGLLRGDYNTQLTGANLTTLARLAASVEGDDATAVSLAIFTRYGDLDKDEDQEEDEMFTNLTVIAFAARAMSAKAGVNKYVKTIAAVDTMRADEDIEKFTFGDGFCTVHTNAAPGAESSRCGSGWSPDVKAARAAINAMMMTNVEVQLQLLTCVGTGELCIYVLHDLFNNRDEIYQAIKQLIRWMCVDLCLSLVFVHLSSSVRPRFAHECVPSSLLQ
jgi:hypothetical protein